MVNLKCHDRKINMLTAFQVNMHFFFSQLMFKIMKVFSLKMVTNMYRDLRSECASEYP